MWFFREVAGRVVKISFKLATRTLLQPSFVVLTILQQNVSGFLTLSKRNSNLLHCVCFWMTAVTRAYTPTADQKIVGSGNEDDKKHAPLTSISKLTSETLTSAASVTSGQVYWGSEKSWPYHKPKNLRCSQIKVRGRDNGLCQFSYDHCS